MGCERLRRRVCEEKRGSLVLAGSAIFLMLAMPKMEGESCISERASVCIRSYIKVSSIVF